MRYFTTFIIYKCTYIPILRSEYNNICIIIYYKGCEKKR